MIGKNLALNVSLDEFRTCVDHSSMVSKTQRRFDPRIDHVHLPNFLLTTVPLQCF